MRKRKERFDKEALREVSGLILKIVPLVVILLILINLLQTGSFTLFGDKAEECAMSRHNTYSNATSGVTYYFGRCFIEMTDTYLSRKECGIFGFSCYESSEPHTETYTTTACFKLKTGEQC